MSEEKTLGELFQDAYREVIPGRARYRRGGKTFRQALDHGAKSVADEAVRRYFRDLPPGDEGLAVAGRAACHAVDPARCAAPWNLMSDVTRRAERAYVAAVLAVQSQRLRDSFKGEPLWRTIHLSLGCMKTAHCSRCEPLADAILARLHAEGWLPPEEAAKLRAEVERLKQEAAIAHGNAERLDVAEERMEAAEKKQREEIERLKKEADSRLCASCLEHHPVDSPCPPFEVRTSGQGWFKGRIGEQRAEIEQLKKELDSKVNPGARAVFADWETAAKWSDAHRKSLEEDVERLKKKLAEARYQRNGFSREAKQAREDARKKQISRDAAERQLTRVTAQRDRAWRAARTCERGVMDCREVTAEAINAMLEGEDVDKWRRIIGETL